MKLLYSDILPLAAEDGQQTIADCFKEQLTKADRLEIAVGYVSRASLEELDELAAKCNIGTVCLNIGLRLDASSFRTPRFAEPMIAANGLLSL